MAPLDVRAVQGRGEQRTLGPSLPHTSHTSHTSNAPSPPPQDTPEETLFFCEGCRQARGKELPKELFIPTSDTLKTDELALYLEKALHDELTSRRVTCEPVTIRVVSNIETKTKFSDQMERQSSMATKGATSGMGADKVKEFPYRSKCILAFQKVHA